MSEDWEKGYDRGFKVGLKCAYDSLKNLANTYKKIILLDKEVKSKNE